MSTTHTIATKHGFKARLVTPEQENTLDHIFNGVNQDFRIVNVLCNRVVHAINTGIPVAEHFLVTEDGTQLPVSAEQAVECGARAYEAQKAAREQVSSTSDERDNLIMQRDDLVRAIEVAMKDIKRLRSDLAHARLSEVLGRVKLLDSVNG